MSIRLRPITVADAPRVHEWASQEQACRYQTWGPNTVEETERYVEEAARTWSDPTQRRRVWVAVGSDDRVVGIGQVVRVTGSTAEIAYAVHVEHWGRGVGTAIARALLDLAFEDAGVERVQATCDPRNTASAGVLRRAGLVAEGTLRHTALLRDGWRDSLMHAVLREEWTAPTT